MYTNLKSRLEYLACLFNLDDWEIKLSSAPLKTPGAIMEVGRIRERKVATIRYDLAKVNKLAQQGENEIDFLLVHELAHLLLDSLECEAEFMIKYSSRARELNDRYNLAREQTVERVARLLHSKLL